MKITAMSTLRQLDKNLETSEGLTGAVESMPDKKKPGRRELKSLKTRRALFAAAAVVVGEYGYEEASITRITEKAGVAIGTFYNYFETRQDLFDQLLPAIGDQLLEFIASRLEPELTGLERERARIIAYFEFFENNNGFLRILNEAEVYAPEAFKRHVQNFAVRYAKALGKHIKNGELSDFEENELMPLAYMLMGIRSYLTMLWRSDALAEKKGVNKPHISAYMKLVEHGLFSSR
ncbi:MAG: TetR/AcrR family transcriptional regulator [Oxalobacteraceae bacterium]